VLLCPQVAGAGGEVPDVEALAPVLRGRWQQLADKAAYTAQAQRQLERFQVSPAPLLLQGATQGCSRTGSQLEVLNGLHEAWQPSPEHVLQHIDSVRMLNDND
jgi:hypothetical protein